MLITKLLNSPPILVGLNILLAIIIFITDIKCPSAIAINTLYIATIMLALWLPNTKHIIYFAVFCVILTIAGAYCSYHNVWSEHFINHAIAIFAIWLTTAFAIHRKTMMRDLETSEQKQRAILDTTIVPIITLENNQIIQSASNSIESIFGWSPSEIIGKEFCSLLAEPFATQYHKYLEDLNSLQLRNPLNMKSEVLAQHRNNSTFPCEISIAKINNPRTNASFFAVGLRDISERKQFEEKLIWLSNHDELTGIFNRRYFNRQIAIEWNRLMRSKIPLALIMLDVDYFKKYNDTLGHQAGDNCLKMIANTANNVITRAGDFAARYGGEEFVILLPNTSHNGVEHIANKIQVEIKTLDIEHPYPDSGGRITVSMGLSAMIPIQACTADVLIQQADHALYQAKNAGKNCYKLYMEE